MSRLLPILLITLASRPLRPGPGGPRWRRRRWDATDGGTDGTDGTDGTPPCEEPGALYAAGSTACWSIGRARPCRRPASPSRWSVPPAGTSWPRAAPPGWCPVTEDASAAAITLDPSAGLTSGLHTGYVTVRDSADPTSSSSSRSRSVRG